MTGTSAIVTGASRGLGRTFALRLAELGADVTIVARSAADLADTAHGIEQLGARCLTIVGDVTDDDVAASAVRRTVERFGSLDLLVNNAGAARIAAFADEPIDAWWDVITVNVRSPAVWIQAALPHMRRQRSGRIINVSSPAAQSPLPFISSYTASKAALSQFTAAIAYEVAPAGIVVLALGPSALTDMSRTLWDNDVMPDAMREGYRNAFADADTLERRSLELFECLVMGGADHLTGEYAGAAAGRFDTPSDLAQRPPSRAAPLLSIAHDRDAR